MRKIFKYALSPKKMIKNDFSLNIHFELKLYEMNGNCILFAQHENIKFILQNFLRSHISVNSSFKRSLYLKQFFESKICNSLPNSPDLTPCKI